MHATRISIAALAVSVAALALTARPTPAHAQTKDNHAAVEQRIMAAIMASATKAQARVFECRGDALAHYPGNEDLVMAEVKGCVIARHIYEDNDRERLALKAEGCRLGVYWFCQKEP